MNFFEFISDYGSNPYPATDRDVQDYAQRQSENRKGFIDTTKAAITEDWLFARDFQEMTQDDARLYRPDPDFRWTPQALQEVAQGIPEEFHAELVEQSHSLEHARFNAERMRDQLRNESVLDNAFAGGLFYRLAAGITDPTAWGATLAATSAAAGAGAAIGSAVPGAGTAAGGAVGGAVGFLGGAAKHSNKLWNITKAALAVGSVSAAQEALLQSQRPISRYEEALYSGLAGLGFGGAVASLASKGGKALKPKDAALSEVDSTLAEAAKDTSRDLVNNVAKEYSDKTAFKTNKKGNIDKIIDSLRYDTVGLIKQDSVQEIKELSKLAEDAVGDSGVLNKASASEVQQLYHDTRINKVEQSRQRNYEKYLLEVKESPAFYEFKKKGQLQESFTRAVDDALRVIDVPDLISKFPKSVQAAAKELSNEYKDMLKLAKEKNIAGFEDIPENVAYSPRLFSRANAHEIAVKFRSKDVSKAIGGAIRSANKELSEEQAEKIGTRMWRVMQDLAYGIDADASFAFQGDASKMREVLKKSSNLSDSEIEDTITLLSKSKSKSKSKVANDRAKRRAFLDETFQTTLTGRDGKEYSFHILDLYDRDAFSSMERYSRKMSGDYALYDTFGWKGPDDADKAFKAAEKAIVEADKNAKGSIKNKSQRNLERAKLLYNAVKEYPLEVPSKKGKVFHDSLRLLRNIQHIRVLNQVGLSQLTEIPLIAARAGIEGFIQGFPGFRALFSDVKHGKLQTEALDEMESVFGIGGFVRRNMTTTAYEDPDFLPVVPDSLLGKAIDKTERLKNWSTNNVSGMSRMNDMLHKWAAQAINYRVLNRDMFSRIPKNRLLDLGLDDSMIARINKQIQGNTKTVEGRFKKRIKALDFSKPWQDEQAWDAYRLFVRRLTYRTIQENDIGNLPAFMLDSSVAKTLFQFRSFLMGAHSKMLLNGLRHRDAETATLFLGSLLGGSVTYMGQVAVNSTTAKDPKKYLEKKLSTQEMAFGIFSKAGWSSWIPSILDTGSQLALGRSLGGARSTGQTVGLIDLNANPTMDFLSSALVAGSTPARALFNGGLSENDVRAIQKIIPFQNAFFFQQALKYSLNSALPTKTIMED